MVFAGTLTTVALIQAILGCLHCAAARGSGSRPNAISRAGLGSKRSEIDLGSTGLRRRVVNDDPARPSGRGQSLGRLGYGGACAFKCQRARGVP